MVVGLPSGVAQCVSGRHFSGSGSASVFASSPRWRLVGSLYRRSRRDAARQLRLDPVRPSRGFFWVFANIRIPPAIRIEQ